MGDFYQKGIISTLHNITDRPVEELERELVEFNKVRPISLVLPSLFSELEGPALSNIIDHLAEVPYLSQIIIGLDQANQEEFRYAKEFFSRLPQPHRILWNHGPRLQTISDELIAKNLGPTEPGKGRNVWYCFGYALSSGKAEVIGLHDCDIVTYDRNMLARLLYPTANPNFPYMFAKGYYARVNDRELKGRVTRLLVTPLIIALKKVLGGDDYLDYIDSFRYPLAGEMSLRTSVLPDLRIPSDWGLEIGILSELRRNYSNKVICQVDIADNYDHKHQDLSKNDPNAGLSRMSTDISKAFFRKLAADGRVFNPGIFRTLKASYYRTALDLVEVYHMDAKMNGLYTDRHREEQAVELFAANITRAGEMFLDSAHETPFLPTWSRVNTAMPDIMRRMHEAVEADHAD